MSSPMPERNLSQSVFDRLKNHAKDSGEDINYVLKRFVIERLLYRIGNSPYQKEFILKGGTLFLAWQGKSYRVTQDVDFLAYGSAEISIIEEKFKMLCSINLYDDGLIFLADTVKGTEIKKDTNYSGVRIKLRAKLVNALIPLQVDIGFGDTIVPQAELIHFPTFLDMPEPELRAYPKYSVIAEKFEIMVSLGIRNSRLKDFYDIWLMSRLFEFDGVLLQEAIEATFKRRESSYPAQVPFALTENFYTDADKVKLWRAFIKRVKSQEEDMNLEKIIQDLISFLMPIVDAQNKQQVFSHHWSYKAQQWL